MAKKQNKITLGITGYETYTEGRTYEEIKN
jgi:hypothetical protein